MCRVAAMERPSNALGQLPSYQKVNRDGNDTESEGHRKWLCLKSHS